MAKCEQRTGFHGEVSRIPGLVECHCPAETEVKYVDVTTNTTDTSPVAFLRVLSELFISTLTGRGIEEDIRGAIIHGILHHGQVDGDGISRLTSRSQKMDRGSSFFLARFFNDLIVVDMRMAEAVKRNSYGRETRPYTLDRRLADMLEVLPTDLSARLLLEALDPDISRSVSAIPIGGLLQRPDNQIYAAEAIVSLPRDARLAILRAMIRIPSARTDIRRLSNLINGQINCLTGAGFLPKLPEVREDLTMLGQRLH